MNLLSRSVIFARWRLGALIGILGLPASAWAQSPAAPLAANPPSADKASEAVKMNPFEVQADSDTSYGALNSNSITSFNTELNKLPLSADIFDRAFMDDVGVTTVEDLIQNFASGVGFTASDPGSVAANVQPGDRNANSYATIRGFYTPAIMRDGLMPTGIIGNQGSTGIGATSNFDVERVEVIEGPQALLYGESGPGGVINLTSKAARFDSPTAGSLSFRVDQYGSKQGTLDVSTGNDHIAMRLAIIDSSIDYNRINIGGQLNGYYGQIAGRIGNTTIRLTAEQTTYNRIVSATTSTFTGLSTTTDSRSGDYLSYLVATNQTGATNPVTGAAYGSGPIDNGYLNWSNYASYSGWWDSETTINSFENLQVQSQWTNWLSTNVVVGYNSFYDARPSALAVLVAPNVAANPTGGWAASFAQPNLVDEPARNRGLRYSALLTNDLFGGKAHSQTIIGGDYVDSHSGNVTYNYYQSDANGNIIVNPALATNTSEGRTIIPVTYFSIANGPNFYPLGSPGSARGIQNGATRLTYNGVNYALQLANPVNPNLISPTDPLGTIPPNGNISFNVIHDQGAFITNNTQWFDGKLETLVGARTSSLTEHAVSSLTSATVKGTPVDVDVGASYALANWLRVYGSFSDAAFPPLGVSPSAVGQLPVVGRGYGEELGFKVQNPSQTLSATLSFYHSISSDESYTFSSTLQSITNPVGLNGSYGSASTEGEVNRVSNGAQLTLTAAPTPNWRLRLSAADDKASFRSSLSYPEVYNDQFYTNGAGQVTYADGTVVNVLPTFNSKTATVPAGTAGATPLTVTALSTPGNAYFAAPVAITGLINTTSAAATVLKTVDPVHGAILTGATGLPISQYQLNPALTGVAPIGIVPIVNQGDLVNGQPQYSMNFTNTYTFSQGWAKGIEVGGSVRASWLNNSYYYYSNGISTAITTGTPRTLYVLPNVAYFDLILGYQWKFHQKFLGRIKTQLNITNLFNHYNMLILPNEYNGWLTVSTLRATLSAPPRTAFWTTTVNF